MKNIEIEKPHGYLKDSEGKIVVRFGNWNVGSHQVPDVVNSVEYVDGPNSHDKQIHEDYQTDE